MAIEVSCPQCGQAYQIPDDKAGKKFRCKNCQETVDIPGRSLSTGDVLGSGFDATPAVPSRREQSSSRNDNDDDEIPNPLKGSRQRRRDRIRRNRDSDTSAYPAIAMYVLSALNLAFWVFLVIVLAVMPEEEQEPDHAVMVGFYAVVGVLQLIVDGLICMGAYNLQTKQSKGLAIMGAVLCCIPCCSPLGLLGVPFGIWALVVTNAEGTFD